MTATRHNACMVGRSIVRAMSVLIVGGGIGGLCLAAGLTGRGMWGPWLGGGMGGLCLAAALTRRGIAYEIVEREPAWTTVGAGISFYPNGVRALRRLGLGEAAVSAGATIELVRTCDRAGNVVS